MKRSKAVALTAAFTTLTLSACAPDYCEDDPDVDGCIYSSNEKAIRHAVDSVLIPQATMSQPTHHNGSSGFFWYYWWLNRSSSYTAAPVSRAYSTALRPIVSMGAARSSFAPAASRGGFGATGRGFSSAAS